MPRAKKAYPNRTDLQPQAVKVGPSKQYGEAAAQQRSQRQLPMAGAPAPSGGGGPLATAASAPPPEGPFPGELGRLADPTARPGEPVTTGLSLGAGAGPEVLGPAAFDKDIEMLRALYRENPLPELAALLDDAGY